MNEFSKVTLTITSLLSILFLTLLLILGPLLGWASPPCT